MKKYYIIIIVLFLYFILLYCNNKRIDSFTKSLSKQEKFSISLKDMKNILDKHNIKFFLCDGTLLGQRRENKFIEYDEDIDIGIFSSDYNVNIKDTIIKSGKFKFIHEFGDFNKNNYEMSFENIKTGIKIDILIFFKENNDDFYYTTTYTGPCDDKPLGYCKWRKHIRGLKKVKFIGTDFMVPKNTDEFLRESYGDDFLIPKKFTYEEGVEKGYYKENFSNNNKKNVIFTSAGDNTNFHNNWIGKNQNYDIWVVYYGNDDKKYNTYKNKVNFIEKRKGSKFQNFNYIWNKYYNQISKYEYFFILDDDIIFDSYKDINRLFDLAKKYDSWIISPTFKTDGSSKISHPITESKKNTLLRYVNFIENGTSLFSKYALKKFIKYYDDSLLGWGVDYLFIWVLGKDIKDKYILVDDISTINPHDVDKNGKREWDKLDNVNNQINDWDNIKKKYNIKEWEHKTFNTIKK